MFDANFGKLLETKTFKYKNKNAFDTLNHHKPDKMEKYANLVNQNSTNNFVNTPKAQSLQEQTKSKTKRKAGLDPDEAHTNLNTDPTHHSSKRKTTLMSNQHLA